MRTVDMHFISCQSIQTRSLAAQHVGVAPALDFILEHSSDDWAGTLGSFLALPLQQQHTEWQFVVLLLLSHSQYSFLSSFPFFTTCLLGVAPPSSEPAPVSASDDISIEMHDGESTSLASRVALENMLVAAVNTPARVLSSAAGATQHPHHYSCNSALLAKSNVLQGPSNKCPRPSLAHAQMSPTAVPSAMHRYRDELHRPTPLPLLL
jgi:hypothetical protein